MQEKIGQGGMGEVYRASDTKLRRAVALKVLPPVFAQDAERMARFQKEAHVLASLNHPHIAQIFGLEEDGGVHALVLELVEGPTLGERIQRGNLPLEEALRIAIQIAQALESAHDMGVIHRDLKPDNVKLTEGGQVKVLDFGLAKAIEAVDSDSGLTQSPTMSPAITGAMTAANVILGTAGYMSPEQARGQTVDKRADIWAFGVVLYEMLVGRRLFTGDTVSDTLAAVLRLDPDWEALPANTPAKVRRILRRCLQRDLSRRLRDVGDARIVLEEVLNGDVDEPVATPGDVAAAPASGKGRLVAGVIAAAIVGPGIGFGLALLMQPKPAEIPLVRFSIPVPDLTTSLGAGGSTAAISRNGRYIAFTSEDQLWIRDLRKVEAEAFPGTQGAVAPFWSPDDEWIGYGTANRLMKIRVTGGTPITLCELEESFNPASGGAWRKDGRIAFTDGNGPVYSVSAQGGDPDTLVALDPELDDDFHNAAILPDDESVMFVVHKKSGDYDRIDAFANGQRRTILEMPEHNLEFPAWSPSGHLVFRREGTNPGMWAVPFNAGRLEVDGEPFLAAPDANLPSVSRTGTLVLTRGKFSETNRMTWVDRNGKPLGTVGQTQNQHPFFGLSPDEKRVAIFVRNEDPDLWIVDVERQTQTRLTFGDETESWACWSHDGTRVYYQDSKKFPDTDLWMMAADGTGEPVRIGLGGWPCLSPDDRTLIYCLHQGGEDDWDLYTLTLGENGLPAGEPELFLDTAGILWGSVFSPDGRFVAYHSNESGRAEIYLKPFPAGSGKWQVSGGGGNWPVWKGDGSELYYVRGTQEIMGVPVELEPTVRLGTPELLFTRPASLGALPFGWPDAFTATSDGQRFLIALPPDDVVDEGVRGLEVVQNWFSEFAAER